MENSNKKLIVFDLNGVLLSKNVRNNDIFSPIAVSTSGPNVKCVYLNKDLQLLGKFYSSHSLYVALWTSIAFCDAESFFIAVCEEAGVEFDCFLTREHCNLGENNDPNLRVRWGKDLRKACSLMKVNLEDSVLIDDSYSKRFEDQPFMLFNHAEGGLIKTIKEIDRFICCKDNNCIAKHL